MIPASIHHVFPYHIGHFANDVESWWAVQMGSWPIAAAQRGTHRSSTFVHVIGDKSEVLDNLIVHRGIFSGPANARYGYDISWSLLRQLKSLGARDVCFVHGAARPIDILCAELAQPARLIGVYHGNGSGGPDRMKQLVERHVVVRSEVKELLANLKYAGEKVVELTPSTADDFFSTELHRKRPDQVIKVGFIGRPSASKGADAIPATVQALRAHGYQVTVEVAGSLESDSPAEVVNAIVDLGASWKSLGFIPNASIPAKMASWDILFFPSRGEGCPRVILEAMAVGLPVVAVEHVIPSKLVDGSLVRVAARQDLPMAVVAAVREDIITPSSDLPYRHSHGAHDLDALVAGLPEFGPTGGHSPKAIMAALGSIAIHSRIPKRLMRPMVHRGRRFLHREKGIL